MKKVLTIILSLFLFVFIVQIGRVSVGADETEYTVLPADTPVPSVEVVEETQPEDVEINNQSSLESSVSGISESGDNEIIEAETDLLHTPVSSPSSEPVLVAENPVQVVGEVPSGTEPPVSAEPTDNTEIEENPGGNGSDIVSGNSISEVEILNSVNTTVVDSEVLFQTINIYLPQYANISINPIAIVENVLKSEKKDEENISVRVTDINNWTYVENNIVSEAVSGNNIIDSSGNASIVSGDSYSSVSLLNNINTVIIGSKLHVLTINIFSSVSGNIVLPDVYDFNTAENSVGNAGDLFISNDSEIYNDVVSTAVSGENSIDGSGFSEIKTGNATGLVNITNLVNTTIANSIYYKLVINVLGTWTGSFMGNGVFEQNTAGMGGVYEMGWNNACQTDCRQDVSIANNSVVTNTVLSSAVSGGNSISGGTGGYVQSGNARSSVSISNIVNSSIIDSLIFLGYINIFDSLTGDIGGYSDFVVPEEEMDQEIFPEVVNEVSDSQSLFFVEEEGKLEVYHKNNVGDYVYPGDTVTFFINIFNKGAGRVYDAKMSIYLLNDKEENTGGGIFELGDIEGGDAFGLSTGLVLSSNAKAGNYIARVSIWGITGSDGIETSFHSDSYFKIVDKKLPLVSNFIDDITSGVGEEQLVPEVLGSSAALPLDKKLFYAFAGLLSLYIPAKGYQKREDLYLAFSKASKAIVPRLLAFRSFLGGFFS